MNLQVKYRTDSTRQYPEWLCFKHAVVAALNGEDIVTEIDDFESEYDMRDTECSDCKRE